jgi:hypothetical protein
MSDETLGRRSEDRTVCTRCNDDGYVMQTLDERTEYRTVGNRGDYEAIPCPACSRHQSPLSSGT